jgi:hypothetical protein
MPSSWSASDLSSARVVIRRHYAAENLENLLWTNLGIGKVSTLFSQVDRRSTSMCRDAGRAQRLRWRPTRLREDWPAEVRFAADSPLEGDGFEPSVPRKETTLVGRPVRSPAIRLSQKKPAPSHQEPMVRIHLLPAESRVQTRFPGSWLAPCRRPQIGHAAPTKR